MAESVVARWIRNIDRMQGDAEQMGTEATKRWSNNLNSLRKTFSSYESKFKGNVNDMRGEIHALSNHIWGTPSERQAWLKRFGRP